MLVEQVNELVKVQTVGQPGEVSINTGTFEPPQPSLMSPGAAGETNAFSSADAVAKSTSALTCYPDGSSDSMDILLSAANGDDQRLALVTLSGLSGRARHRIFTPGAEEASPADEFDGYP